MTQRPHNFLQKLELKGFRCFKAAEFDFDNPLMLIHGANGSGKTSLLEALHYLCYLRSFRTHAPKDLVRFGSEGFFIRALFADHEIRIGFAQGKRHIKADQKAISSYQELHEFYRVVTVTEDDLGIIKGGPEKRRTFIDHALVLARPQLMTLFKEFRVVLENRNALLERTVVNPEELEIWTQKLWYTTQLVQAERKQFIAQLQETADHYLAAQWDGNYRLTLVYEPKKRGDDVRWSDFYTAWQKEGRQAQELRMHRSLFGAHLDDISLLFQDKPARLYSSRGQQKLIVLLLKLAQINMLLRQEGALCFLVDDFIADLDEQVMRKFISVCTELGAQLIFTTPLKNGLDSVILKGYGASELNLQVGQ